MAIRKLLRRRPLLRELRGQEEEIPTGSYIEIYDNHVDVYKDSTAAFPSRTVDYTVDMGCNITYRALRISEKARFIIDHLELTATPGKLYEVRKTPDGGAEVDEAYR